MTPRSGHRRLLPAVILVLLVLPANAFAFSKGTISGTVTDAAGPVAGARVLPVSSGGWPEAAITDAAGHYQLEVWPGTYGVGVYPADEAADGFRGVSGVVVAEAATTSLDIQLPFGRRQRASLRQCHLRRQRSRRRRGSRREPRAL